MESSDNSSNAVRRRDPQKAKEDDRRSQSRAETVLSQIEDATYAVLRKHEKRSA
ncbi:MAG TPA: hypothetical protein VMT28_06865 [Terriglobales bacterium]|jgi:hypothetical protein|nr:hypothetical protein [Terriglobales bacterium]